MGTAAATCGTTKTSVMGWYVQQGAGGWERVPGGGAGAALGRGHLHRTFV
jgi:hypothetical protein